MANKKPKVQFQDPVDQKLHDLLCTDEIDKLNEKHLSVHSLNPFINQISGSRATMLSQHASQIVTLVNAEEKIIQSGLDHQFGATTFSVKIEADCEVIGIIQRYAMITEEHIPEILLIVRNLDDGMFDYYSIPNYHLLSQVFGFEYKLNQNEIETLFIGKVLEEGTILADSPSVKKNSGYGFGINNKIALMTLPEVAEDGVIISESAANRLAHTIYETRTVKFGSDKFLLNMYGDDKEYKGFPELGEYVNEDSILAALRSHNDVLASSLTSVTDLQQFDNNFDETIYVRGPGGKVKIGDKEYDTGIVVDIKCYHNTKAKSQNDVYPYTLGNIDKYTNGLKSFYRDIWDQYRTRINIEKYRSLSPDRNVLLSPRYSRLLQQAMVLGEVENKKIQLTQRDIPLDVYTMEFTIKYTSAVKVGNKISCLHGGKGVIVEIRPDHLMPKDVDGKPVDIVMDPTSIISRMNIGRLSEIYISASSRVARRKVLDLLDQDKKKEAWDTIVRYLSILDTEQHVYYSNATDVEKEEIFEEIRKEELYIFYRVSSPKPAIMVIRDLERSEFKPVKEKIIINNNGVETYTKNPVLIGVLYNILLNKTPEEALSVTSDPWVNHFQLPTSPPPSMKHNLPFKNSSVRFMGETETRLFLAYGGAELLAELKDRANNPETFKNIYKNLLNVDTPGFTENIVTREEAEFGQDVALILYRTILNAAGYDLEYVEDEYSQFNGNCDPQKGINKGKVLKIK